MLSLSTFLCPVLCPKDCITLAFSASYFLTGSANKQTSQEMGVKKENKKDPLPGKLCCGSGYIPLPKAKFTSAGPSPPVTASSSPCPCLSCPCGLKPRALLASGFPLVTEQHLQDTGQKEESEILIPIPLVPTLRCHLGLERSSSD